MNSELLSLAEKSDIDFQRVGGGFLDIYLQLTLDSEDYKKVLCACTSARDCGESSAVIETGFDALVRLRKVRFEVPLKLVEAEPVEEERARLQDMLFKITDIAEGYRELLFAAKSRFAELGAEFLATIKEDLIPAHRVVVAAGSSKALRLHFARRFQSTEWIRRYVNLTSQALLLIKDLGNLERALEYVEKPPEPLTKSPDDPERFVRGYFAMAGNIRSLIGDIAQNPEAAESRWGDSTRLSELLDGLDVYLQLCIGELMEFAEQRMPALKNTVLALPSRIAGQQTAALNSQGLNGLTNFFERSEQFWTARNSADRCLQMVREEEYRKRILLGEYDEGSYREFHHSYREIRI